MQLSVALRQLSGRLDPIHTSGTREAVDRGLREAAVLVLLFERDGNAYLVLTLRPDTMTHHASQISLPGGRIESTDASAWDAALREVVEELGIGPEGILPIGRLDAIPIRASGHRVVPFVAWIDPLPTLTPAEDEVAEIIETPLDGLLDPTRVATTTWDFREQPWRVVHFCVGGHMVWGATARILADLAERLGAQWIGDPPGTVQPLDRP